MKASKYLQGAYKEDFAPPLELAEAAPAAPIRRRTAFNAAPIKKAKLPGVVGVQMKEVEDYLKLTRW
eukprot:jgi/Tetstr1/466627/TSEL_011115.t1